MGYDATGGKPYKSGQDGLIWYGIVGGAMALTFGAVFLGPKLLGNSEPKERTISSLVKGRNVPQAAGVINAYGFEDNATRAFISMLARHEKVEHAELMTDLARDALAGAGREQLALKLVDWSQDYAMRNLHALSNMDASLIDEGLGLVREALGQVNQIAPDVCLVSSNMTQPMSQDEMRKLVQYKAPLYNVSMKGNALLVKMVISGRERASKVSDPVAPPTTEDMSKLQVAMISMMADPEVQQVMMMAQGAGASNARVNVCSLGSKVIEKVEALPGDTRMRLWSAALRGDIDGTGMMSGGLTGMPGLGDGMSG